MSEPASATSVDALSRLREQVVVGWREFTRHAELNALPPALRDFQVLTLADAEQGLMARIKP